MSQFNIFKRKKSSNIRLNIDQCNGVFPSLSDILKNARFLTNSFTISWEPENSSLKNEIRLKYDNDILNCHDCFIILPFMAAKCNGDHWLSKVKKCNIFND